MKALGYVRVRRVAGRDDDSFQDKRDLCHGRRRYEGAYEVTCDRGDGRPFFQPFQ